MNPHRISRNGRGFILEPHEAAVVWNTDGVLAPPGFICMAVSEVKNQQCPKESIAVLPVVEAEVRYGVDAPAREAIFLCGGHFAVHRRGKPLRLAVVSREWA